ncbi:HEPN domain-containing protein [Leptolyngbya boryana CZ1]|uniref:HEPN domain-containing protein n=1 Tax=Leptolyngbya boryana CZ1 TaxID=3060204 RepID=A0AA97AMX1_LEPBY|nr:HEPN domain-containing protein [Leptolyngbya boryana]WNZ43599.1 HEPN domain-containing protein [Leptolyngbya boryana CZ1]
MIFNFNDTKSKRKAKYVWEKVLLKLSNYFNDPKEIIKVPFAEIATYKLEIASGAYLYPKERAKEEIRNLANIIYQIPEIKRCCSFGTVYKSVKHELQSELSFVLEENSLRDFETVIESLFCKIRSSMKTYDFYFSLEGIELTKVSIIDFGSIQILKFDREQMNKVLRENNQADNAIHTEFVSKNFLDKVCIKCRCSGDFETSKKLAELKARETINYFRYMICLLFHKRIHENLLKINVVSETYVDENQILAREVTSGNLLLQWDSTRKTSEDFPIDRERVDELKDKLYFDIIVKILNSDSRTELEGCLLTAMYWSGEAQNEFDWDIAFLKYWTALECIFSCSKEDITSSLARGISTLAAFSEYQFVKPDEINQIFKAVSNLYDKRSKIVHRGLRNSVNEVELVEVCKYTSWTILSLMRLISIGYQDTIQLHEQIVRLYENRPI